MGFEIAIALIMVGCIGLFAYLAQTVDSKVLQFFFFFIALFLMIMSINIGGELITASGENVTISYWVTENLTVAGNLTIEPGGVISGNGSELYDVNFTGAGDMNAVNTPGDYLYGGATSGDANIIVNETYLNITIGNFQISNFTNDALYITENVSGYFNVSGNLTADNITAASSIYALYLHGDGSNLTGITATGEPLFEVWEFGYPNITGVPTLLSNFTNDIGVNASWNASAEEDPAFTIWDYDWQNITDGPDRLSNFTNDEFFVNENVTGNFNVSGDIIAGWFNGTFNWTADDDYVIFDGSLLTFNTSKLETTYYNVSTVSIVAGTEAGLIADTYVYDGVSYNASEEVATPGFDIRFNFTAVTDFNGIIIRMRMDGKDHPVNIQLWDYDGEEWESYSTVVEIDGYEIIELGVYDSTTHINASNSNNVQLRLLMDSIGNSNHDYFFDWIQLKKGLATASTQRTDPLSYHINDNITTEGNTSADYTMVAADLSVGGNAIVTGNITAAGNVTGDYCIIAAGLDVGGDATVTGNITVTGNVSAAYFIGDGTGLSITEADPYFVGWAFGYPNITGVPTLLSNFTDDLGDRGWWSSWGFGYNNMTGVPTLLSNFTDDLGDRGWWSSWGFGYNNMTGVPTLLSNFTDDLNVNASWNETHANDLYVEDSDVVSAVGNWSAEFAGVLNQVLNDTTPQLGGYLDTNTEDIGSSSDEIEDVYIATDSVIYLGDEQEGEISYNGSSLVIKVN